MRKVGFERWLKNNLKSLFRHLNYLTSALKSLTQAQLPLNQKHAPVGQPSHPSSTVRGPDTPCKEPQLQLSTKFLMSVSKTMMSSWKPILSTMKTKKPLQSLLMDCRKITSLSIKFNNSNNVIRMSYWRWSYSHQVTIFSKLRIQKIYLKVIKSLRYLKLCHRLCTSLPWSHNEILMKIGAISYPNAQPVSIWTRAKCSQTMGHTT